MESIVTVNENWDFRQIANRTVIQNNDRMNFLKFMGVKNLDTKDVITFNDVKKNYMKYWHEMDYSEKLKNANNFKQTHEWVMGVVGLYNLKPYKALEIEKDYCHICKGSGLFTRIIYTKEQTTCPECMGTGIQTYTCVNCNGIGCNTCNGKGYYIFYSTKKREAKYCKLCGLDTPFGKMKGTGKVIRRVGEVKYTTICNKCNGTGKGVK